MPVLKDFRHIKEIELPSYPESKVVIYSSLLTKDTDLATDLQEGKKATQLLMMMPKLIKEWNFTNDAGEVLPITAENINLIDHDDLLFIIEQVEAFSESLKKK